MNCAWGFSQLDTEKYFDMDNNNNIYFKEILRCRNTMDSYSLISYSGTRSMERAPLEVNLSDIK